MRNVLENHFFPARWACSQRRHVGTVFDEDRNRKRGALRTLETRPNRLRDFFCCASWRRLRREVKILLQVKEISALPPKEEKLEASA